MVLEASVKAAMPLLLAIWWWIKKKARPLQWISAFFSL